MLPNISLYDLSVWVLPLVIAITFHEAAHAFVAHRLGDNTASQLGRVSFNPLKHLDPFGTLLLVLAGFGYGKPVPFNESRLRSAFGVTLVAIAGPLANVGLAALCAIPLRFGTAGTLGDTYESILGAIVIWNCVLAIFNLVPIPPLDGANVVYGLLPPRQQYSWRTYQQYGPFLLLLILLAAPQILSSLVFGPANALARFLVGV